MINLIGVPEKIEKFNELKRNILGEYIEGQSSSFMKPTESLDDMYLPYEKWLNGFTDEEREKFKLIPDTISDFTGFYISHHDDHWISNLTNFNAEFTPVYGVVDNASQILENIPDLDGNKIVIMSPVFSDKTKPHTGWRWHKNGHYYGVQNHSWEHLNDEPDIEMIYIFTVYKVIPIDD